MELQKNVKVYTKDGTSPVSTVFINTKDISKEQGSKFQLKTINVPENRYN